MKKIEGGLRLKGIYKKDLKKKPLITIITTNLNSKGLYKTINSVKKLKYRNIDYIIVDGGSKNNFLDILKKNNKHIDYWVSEKDEGIWDAYNKGFKLARGSYIGLLPSDDLINPLAINFLIKYIKKYPKLDFIAGAVEKQKIYSGFNANKIKYKFNLLPSFAIGFFVKKKSLVKVGLLKKKYDYCADYDLLYRMIVRHKMKGIGTMPSEVFGKFKLGGYSGKAGFFKLLYWELKVRFDNKQFFLWLLFIFFGRVYKKIYYFIFK